VKEEVIGRRYAKALIELGREQGTWQDVGKALGEFVALFEGNDILRKVLCDPIHDRKTRKAILKEVLSKLNPGTICTNFLQLLVDKERIRYLPAIYSAYQRLEDSLAGRLRARLVTARRIEAQEMASIQKALEQRFQKRIILDWSEDPEILGGAVCKVDGMVFDGSVRTQLETLKESMKGE
jgi:F-type H+-transporting ATPase subunit delta